MPQQRKSGVYVPPEVNATEQRVNVPVATQQTQTTILTPTTPPPTGKWNPTTDPTYPSMYGAPYVPPNYVPPVKTGNLDARVSQIESDITELSRIQQTYPQVMGTASQKSDADIWAHLDDHVWGHTGNQNAIYPQLQKTQAEIREEVHPKLQSLGDAMLEAQAHRTSIEQKVENKAERGHSHNGNECDCDAWDISCELGCKFGWLKWVLVAIGIGILLYLLRPIFNLIGIFKGGSP